MKRIALNAIVPSTQFAKGVYAHFLALQQLKSYLIHKGMNRDFQIDIHMNESSASEDDIAGQIIEQRPDIVGFSVYPWNAEYLKGLCKILKKRSPGTFMVLGGPYVSFLADRWMAETPVDMIVIGEGEDVFFRVLSGILRNDYDFQAIPNLIYRNGTQLIRTHTDHYFDITREYYPMSLEDANSEVLLYETSRGCPFKCRYCSWNISGKRIRFFPREKIHRDLEAIFRRPHVRTLGFVDSDLTLNKRHFIWLLGEIHRLNNARKADGFSEICLTFETNPEHLDGEIIDEIEKLPMRDNNISCGLQTMDETMSNEHLNRRFNKEKYMQNLRRLCERLKPYNNWINLEIIYGLPGDTLEGFKKTLDQVMTELPGCFCMYFRFCVLPGSYFWDHSEDYKLVYQEKPPHKLIRSDTFSEADMHQAERLSFFLYMFSGFLNSVSKSVIRNIRSNRLQVYEDVMDHIARSYPDFVAEFYALFKKYGSLSTMIVFTEYMRNKNYNELRYRIIREAREIVRKHAQSETRTLEKSVVP